MDGGSSEDGLAGGGWVRRERLRSAAALAERSAWEADIAGGLKGWLDGEGNGA